MYKTAYFCKIDIVCLFFPNTKTMKKIYPYYKYDIIIFIDGKMSIAINTYCKHPEVFTHCIKKIYLFLFFFLLGYSNFKHYYSFLKLLVSLSFLRKVHFFSEKANLFGYFSIYSMDKKLYLLAH